MRIANGCSTIAVNIANDSAALDAPCRVVLIVPQLPQVIGGQFADKFGETGQGSTADGESRGFITEQTNYEGKRAVSLGVFQPLLLHNGHNRQDAPNLEEIA